MDQVLQWALSFWETNTVHFVVGGICVAWWIFISLRQGSRRRQHEARLVKLCEKKGEEIMTMVMGSLKKHADDPVQAINEIKEKFEEAQEEFEQKILGLPGLKLMNEFKDDFDRLSSRTEDLENRDAEDNETLVGMQATLDAVSLLILQGLPNLGLPSDHLSKLFEWRKCQADVLKMWKSGVIVLSNNHGDTDPQTVEELLDLISRDLARINHERLTTAQQITYRKTIQNYLDRWIYPISSSDGVTWLSWLTTMIDGWSVHNALQAAKPLSEVLSPIIHMKLDS